VKKHWLYACYVARHKKCVFQAGRRRGVPLWQLIVHDLSKFRPDEWRPYAEWFYGYNGGSWSEILRQYPDATSRIGLGLSVYALVTRALKAREAMLLAFVKHLHRNPHHWQYWVLSSSGENEVKVFEIPARYAREMLADWDGAGRAITGKWETPAWYARNRHGQVMHPSTRAFVDKELGWSK